MPRPTTPRLRAAGVAAVAAAFGLLPLTPALAAAPPVPTPPDIAESSAAHVAAEDRRLTEVRTVTSLARWQGQEYKTAYRMSTGTGYTLVLTARSAPYTVGDLLQLAPQTFLRLSDGSYLLSEHIVVSTGATLQLSQPGGLSIRLASSSKGFVSIVSLGGRLELQGEAGAHLAVSSWDLDEGKVDTDLADGRAYVRSLGGQFDARFLDASHLGFWSGRTGGIALTGTDRPNTGAIEPLGSATQRGVPSVLEGVTTQPAGPLQQGQRNPNLNYAVPVLDYVSSNIRDTTIDGNAFGLFVSGANGVQVVDSEVRGSVIAGIVMHRFVTNGLISKTVARDNAGDGVTLDRATTGITLSEVTANGNAGNGIRVSGRPIAEGPSATGSATNSFGGNSVANSTANGNGNFGILVQGGFNIGVQNNRVTGNDMGIVINGPAERVSVTGNEVGNTRRHGIALTEQVTASTVTGNVVDGAATGIYIRASQAQIKGNTVQGARSHGVSLVGPVGGSNIGFNVLAGAGASALDVRRSTGDVVMGENRVDGWDDTSPWYFWFKKLLQPMTALWAVIALLILTSAARSQRRPAVVVHPYAHQMAHHGPTLMPGDRVVDLTERDDDRVLTS
ncbi:MAG: putative rane protein [Frankiales bacterium]|jgi:nitrous oxidase accessory protein NosD|nr:putative rane protein [Frankiales bacterium]